MSAHEVKGKPHRCVYCGRTARRSVLGVTVCPSHDDLPRLDPAYADRRKDAPSQWAEAA